MVVMTPDALDFTLRDIIQMQIDLEYEPLELVKFEDRAKLFNLELQSTIIWAARTTGTKHWRSSLPLTTDTSKKHGISLDMFQPRKHVYLPNPTPENINYHGVLLFQYNDGKLTSSKPFLHHETPFIKTVTIADVHQLILSNKLQYYRFHPAGSGCMYWQLHLIKVMEDSGWVGQGSYDVAQAAIADVVDSGGVPWPPREGEFYKVSSRTEHRPTCDNSLSINFLRV